MPSSQSFCWETLVEQNSWSNPADLSCCLAWREFCLQLLPQRHIARLLQHWWCRHHASHWLSRQRCWVQKNGLWKPVCLYSRPDAVVLRQTPETNRAPALCTNVMSLLAIYNHIDQSPCRFFKKKKKKNNFAFLSLSLFCYRVCLVISLLLSRSPVWILCPLGSWLPVFCCYNLLFRAQHSCLLPYFPLLAQEWVANTVTKCLSHHFSCYNASVINACSAFYWVTRHQLSH